MDSYLIRGFDGCYETARFGNVFVVAFAGLRGSGKSTVADALNEELSNTGIDAARFSFASRIKEVVNTLIGNTTWDKGDMLYSGSDWDIRQFLMRFGTEFIRDGLGEDFWVDVVAHQILERNPSVAIIDDMRFPKNLFTISGILSTLLISMFFIYAKKVSQYYYQKAV